MRRVSQVFRLAAGFAIATIVVAPAAIASSVGLQEERAVKRVCSRATTPGAPARIRGHRACERRRLGSGGADGALLSPRSGRGAGLTPGVARHVKRFVRRLDAQPTLVFMAPAAGRVE